ncbi:hypothetical protein [Mucisphaera sp.]|uniref:hypothetical protein n=1 Tax=Mucisphaera sp. TaxID=2913024 RepID=UPI003D0FEFD4
MNHAGRWTAILLIAVLSLSTAGCDFFAWMALGYEQTQEVDAAYTGLEGRSVAVLVAADDQILFQHPTADRLIGQQVSATLAQAVDNIRIAEPSQIRDFIEENPYWETLLPSQLIEGLGVDRLLLVGLYEYRLHEPGNAHVWRGIMSADISVIEAEAEDPDNASFATVIEAEYPTVNEIGVINSDSQSIEFGLLQTFAVKTANLFRKHEVPR